MTNSVNPRFTEILTTLLDRQELPPELMRQMIGTMMRGECGEAEAAAFLTALRAKGETAAEIATAAVVLREHMLQWQPQVEGTLDTCGTGGDGQQTFNISTATAIVVAAAGVPVVKHGNRAVSSRSGSADVLVELGVRIDGDATSALHCLKEAGLAFCFAPTFHPAMRNVAAVRRKLGIPTIFNCLGPLANPAGARYQLLGVGRSELLDLMAGALERLETHHALVVSGADGLDEISLSAPTEVRQVANGKITRWEWTPADFGLEPCLLGELHAKDPADSAAIIRNVLNGESGPATRIVLANAAAALIAAERAASPLDGVAKAREAIQTGRARRVVEKLVDISNAAR